MAVDTNFGITRTTSVFTKAHTTFSGTDIGLFVNGKRVTKAQSISYSITREKAPIYVLGSADPVNFSRGKRGIAGSLILSSGASDAWGEIMRKSEFAAKDTDLAYFLGEGGKISDFIGANNLPPNATNTTATIKWVPPIYYDQLLPFDIVIMGANEYGQLAQMVIYGLEIITVGSGLSIDDTSSETQMSYIAKSITLWNQKVAVADGVDFTSSITFNPQESSEGFGTGGYTE